MPDVAGLFPRQSLSLSLSFSLSLFQSNLHGQAPPWKNQFGVEDTITSGWVMIIYDNFMMVNAMAVLKASHWQKIPLFGPKFHDPDDLGKVGHELRKSTRNVGGWLA